MRDYAKEAKVLHDKFKKDLVKYWDEAMQLLLDYQGDVDDLGIIDEDFINELLIDYAKDWGYQRVACFLHGIVNNLNQDFYRFDGYGNLDSITANWIELTLSDIANN